MRKKQPNDAGDTVPKLLGIVADLLRGDRHSRRTIADKTGRSLPTADRWIESIVAAFPNVRRVREGKTNWLSLDGRRRDVPTKTAVVGACVSASLASIFEGSQQERNLKDARDYLLRVRGESYGDLDRKFFFVAKGGEYALPEKHGELDEIVGALLDERLLDFAYRHNDGRVEALTVAPLSLVLFDHQLYVLARRSDGSLYAYRFARMSNVDATAKPFTYPPKNEFDPRAVFGPHFGIHLSNAGPIEDVEVVLDEPWATYATTHRWHPTQQATRADDGRVCVSLRVRLCPELETWALSFGEHAIVVKPSALRSAVARRAAKAAERYTDVKRVAKAGLAKTTEAKPRSSRQPARPTRAGSLRSK